jgi:hypothetical protein
VIEQAARRGNCQATRLCPKRRRLDIPLCRQAIQPVPESAGQCESVHSRFLDFRIQTTPRTSGTTKGEGIIAKCLDYAKIAHAAYFTGASQYYEDPAGHMVDDWTVQHWETGTLFGDGFQGGIRQWQNDVVVGCCGTNPGEKGKFLSDVSADLRIGLRILPNQASSARKMVVAAKQIAGNRRVSVTGHSLGSGLAQIMGVWEQVPFVTFNAPAMRDVIRAANINVSKPMMMIRTLKAKSPDDTVGVNFRIRGMGSDGVVRIDLVSAEGIAGTHVGMVVDLPAASSTGAHGKNTCWQAVLSTDWWSIDPFGG